MGQISARLNYAPNKQFKSDSARVAFLLCVGLVVKVVCGSTVLRASHLNWALVANEKIAAKTECLGLIVRVLCSILHFELRDLGLRN
ncbi:DUF3265 domain-containing protein [Vibrio parahaemolyticus]|nr:DUF3265 domain-containing protein [Vibrio parahaemolyticus]MDF5346173.1 DUF3265 domain-containing protein [Vibrio parahaemolyticus]